MARKDYTPEQAIGILREAGADQSPSAPYSSVQRTRELANRPSMFATIQSRRSKPPEQRFGQSLSLGGANRTFTPAAPSARVITEVKSWLLAP